MRQKIAKHLSLIFIILQIGVTHWGIASSRNLEELSSLAISENSGMAIANHEFGTDVLHPNFYSLAKVSYWVEVVEQENENEDDPSTNYQFIPYPNFLTNLLQVEAHFSTCEYISSFPSLYLKFQVFRL